MKPILEIQGISKKFMIDHETQPYLSLRESISGFFKQSNKKTKEEFWALNDVSFNVMPGDTVGIIGKNGAGKSTLLKILSKITPPSKGKIISRGRIASLLEVGTGFHPELTGRENIFMNGSILGMRKVEIQKNFDAIVNFSGVEKFLDTPLKHYSSGMQLRLAFAVAAFLENEILIIDEVLAVGDAEFQKKCLGKMEDVSKSGRTVLFVSHNMPVIESLCKRGVLLNKGSLEFEGTSVSAVEKYLKNFSGIDVCIDRKMNKVLKNFSISSSGSKKDAIQTHDDLIIKGELNLEQRIPNSTIGVVIRNIFETPILSINNAHYGVNLELEKSASFKIILFDLPLSAGVYFVDMFIGDGATDQHVLEKVAKFEITERALSGMVKNPDARINAIVLKKANWELS